jgi:hypothetical protein
MQTAVIIKDNQPNANKASAYIGSSIFTPSLPARPKKSSEKHLDQRQLDLKSAQHGPRFLNICAVRRVLVRNSNIKEQCSQSGERNDDSDTGIVTNSATFS